MTRNPRKPRSPRFALMRRIARIVFVLLCAVLCLIAVTLLFIRFNVGPEHIERYVVPNLERTSGMSLSYSSAKVFWLSLDHARITIAGLECRDTPTSPSALTIPKAVFEFRLLPILRGVLFFSRADLSSPLWTLRPMSKSQRATRSSGQREAPSFPIRPAIGVLKVTGGKVVASQGPVQNPKETLFSDIKILASGLTLGGAKNFNVEGRIPWKDGAGSFDIAGTLVSTPYSRGEWQGNLKTRLQESPIEPWRELCVLLGYNPGFSRGKVNLEANLEGSPRTCQINGKARFSNLVLTSGRYFSRSVSVRTASCRLSAKLNKGSVQIDFKELKLPGLDLSMEAGIGKLGSVDSPMTVAIRKAVLDLKAVSPLLPTNLMSKEDRDRLVKAGLEGRIRVKGGVWSGRYSSLRTKPWEGMLGLEINLDDVSGFVPGYGLKIQHATGGIHLSADKMEFSGMSLKLGNSPVVLKGKVTDLQKSPQLDLFLSLDAKGKDFKPIFLSKALADRLPLWMGSVTEAEGGLAVKLHAKGALSTPNLDGDVTFDDFRCSLEGFSLPLSGITGSLKFEKSSVALNDVQGLVGGSSVRATGSVTPSKTDVEVELELLPEDVKKVRLLPDGLIFSGKVPVSLRLAGNPRPLEFSIRTDLTKNGLRMGRVAGKKPGTPLVLEVSGSRDGEETAIEEAYLILKKTRVSAKGKVDGKGGINISVNLPPKGITTEDLIPFMHPVLNLKPGGRLEGDARIQGGPRWPDDAKAEGTLLVNHLSLRIPGFHKPMTGATGRIRLRGKSLYVTLERAKLGNTELAGHCFIQGFQKPKLKITLESSFLDTTDFTTPEDYATQVTWSEWIRTNPAIRFIARGEGVATIKVVKGRTAVRVFSNFQTELQGKQGLIEAQNWKLEFAGGTLRGRAQFDVRAKTKEPLKLEFQGDHLGMKGIMASDPERVSIEGNTTVEGHMAWKLNPRRENYGIYKNGAMEFRVRKGTIHRFEILSKIFSLINLGSILRGRLPDVTATGLPFQRMSWKTEVFDDKWKVRDFELFSDAARISATGMYFSGQQRVDFTVKVAPLVGIDTVLSGLFGKLITKDGKVLSTTFHVRGLYGSPDVRLMAPETLR
jgi:AsmA-like C-terminal region/Protein of unknown function